MQNQMFTLLVFIKFVSGDIFPPLVELSGGKIEGSLDRSLNGRHFFAFEGVPYARPPVGKYRFKEPIPVKPWTGTLIAKTSYKCMQYNQYTREGEDFVVGDEDCLYLNIYSPKLDQEGNLDVIVYIHGGAFMFNYASFQQPHYLMDKYVVYVSLNYRLGPLGFLSTEDDVVPGNNGIKDQIMALQWIKDNIRNFGGNPNSVTIIGMSAGGASVHLHYLIPKSKGLFSKGISQSGVALNPWVIMENALEKSKKLAGILGCPMKDVKKMVKCLKKRSGRQIVGAVKEFLHWLYNPFSPFGVVVDSWSSDPLVPDHPYKLIKNKQTIDLPWMASNTNSEGLYPCADFYYDKYLKEIDERWNELMPHILDYNYTVDSTLHNFVSEKVRKFYLGDQKLSKTNFMNLVRLSGDRLFEVDLEKATRLQASIMESPVYYYQFAYRGQHSKSEPRTGVITDFGAAHGDDTSYIFKTSVDVTSNENDTAMVKFLVDIVTSFAKNGKPAIPAEWPPLSKNTQDPFTYLKIGSSDKIGVESKEALGNRQFWDTLPIKENEKLFIIKDEL